VCLFKAPEFTHSATQELIGSMVVSSLDGQDVTTRHQDSLPAVHSEVYDIQTVILIYLQIRMLMNITLKFIDYPSNYSSRLITCSELGIIVNCLSLGTMVNCLKIHIFKTKWTYVVFSKLAPVKR